MPSDETTSSDQPAPSESPVPRGDGTGESAVETAPLGPAPSVAEDGESIAADHVELTRAAVGRVESAELSVHQGAIGAARADRIDIDQGALGAALAGEVEIERSYARTVLAREVELEQAVARTVIAGEVHAEGSFIGILLARNVTGSVRVLLDWRGAAAFGVVAGILAGLIGRTRRGGDRTG